MQHKFDPEKLRPAIDVCEPDPRSASFVRVDCKIGTCRPVSIDDQHEHIASFALHSAVPEEIVLQFEVARNLYLYGWFVYRFSDVAQHHALACLELALRMRLAREIGEGRITSPRRKPTLGPLLRYAIDQGLVRNEGFERWRNRGEINAFARVEMEKLREASEKGLKEITWSEADIEITDEDMDWDYKNVLAKILPMMRNDAAHGSTNLNPFGVPGVIQLVSEIINQLYGGSA